MRKKRKFKKGEICISPVNYKKSTGEKVGVHNVIVRRDKEGDLCDTKLISHSRSRAHKIRKQNLEGDSSFLDDKSYISKENFKSVKKFMRKRKAKYRF